MSGNTIGRVFRITTWGESHGAALGAVIDGCPPGLSLSQGQIQAVLDRRKPGGQRFASPRQEADRVEILSGVFEGKTTGTPIALLIRNRDADSGAYEHLRSVFRPGHGDYTYYRKYGLRDHRGGGRASGRETAARVAAGAVASLVTEAAGIQVLAYTVALGGICISRGSPGRIRRESLENSLYCPDPEAAARMLDRLAEVRQQGDTLGGIVEIVVRGCPAGLGEPVFDKMDADLAGALMSIGTVKGVEIGAGFSVADMLGSESNDPLSPGGFLSNTSGGILAGITSGEEIVMRVACKPIPSISRSQQTIDAEGHPTTLSIGGRHDVCVIPRIVPVCEAMVQIVLADHLLRQKAVTP
ncbi:chorismate synthase [Syntrophus buswellii]|jgi:chorismate synthase|uniref:chorismate synthase n=1 Tax=Syntrophus buswellii TaxID=43774 RepID=UPI0009CEB796|nr:MAG: Chorismate synthase [Syntrophus sp. PtaB.Bin138]